MPLSKRKNKKYLKLYHKDKTKSQYKLYDKWYYGTTDMRIYIYKCKNKKSLKMTCAIHTNTLTTVISLQEGEKWLGGWYVLFYIYKYLLDLLQS